MHRRKISLKGSIISCQPSEASQHCAVKESEQRKKAVYDRTPSAMPSVPVSELNVVADSRLVAQLLRTGHAGAALHKGREHP